MQESILSQLIEGVATIFVTLILPALGAILFKWLKKHGLEVKAAQQDMLMGLATEGVMVASQLGQGMSGSERQRDKKNMAVRHLMERAADVGIKVGMGVAGDLVEAGVNRLKRDRGAI